MISVEEFLAEMDGNINARDGLKGDFSKLIALVWVYRDNLGRCACTTCINHLEEKVKGIINGQMEAKKKRVCL